MTGLVKAKQYDWKDSNLAMFGSDTEKQVKRESAASEPAWQKMSQGVGLQVWRLVKFKVQSWPKEDYGKFYDGDSYILLNTYKEEDEEELQYDVHFWIGKHSSQDEYGTAAYKTVELDTFLEDKPVQHREVQGHESDLFKSYFSQITIMQGGAESGFRHVKPEEYIPRLFHISGTKKNIMVKQVSLQKESVTSKDVFILDKGLQIWQFNGSECNKDERFKATQYLQTIKSERNGKASVEVIEEADNGAEFLDNLEDFFNANEEDTDDREEDDNKTTELFRLSDESGSLDFNKSKEGRVFKGDFSSKDVFILDNKKDVFVWVGRGASKSESKNAMAYAHNYLKNTKHPFLPVTCVREGKESKAFRAAIAA